MAEVKANFWRARRRVYRPWIAEPGMWAQWDWGTGPVIAGRQSWLFCAWLGWSRFRMVIRVWDKTIPTVIGCLDQAMRAFGGAPTYWLTDNGRTVTTDHVAGIAVRHPAMVARPLRRHDRHLRPSGSGVQGRLGGDGAHRQGRPGPHPGQPA